ncbi:MAG: preprotein translocase subunit SecG [Nitrospirota bacterium]|nr:preprotein translocase subunit SecG [Nitrospirota bacterium]
MTVLLIIIHVLVSLFLIGVVLIQSGKGAEMGASFGAASSHTIFGSRGPGSFLGKLTTGAAILFMITSFSLAFIGKKGIGGSSVMPAHTEAPAPAVTTTNLPEPAAAPGAPAGSAPAAPAAPSTK